MSKNLKRVLVTGAALLMVSSLSTGVNNVNVNAQRVRSHQVTKVNHRNSVKKLNNRKLSKKNKKNVKKSERRHKSVKINKRRNRKYIKKGAKLNKRGALTRKNKRNHKRIAKRLLKKSRRRARRNKRNNRVLKARYTRSNNRRLLRQSGFVDLNKLESATPEIVSKYAPNNRKAVIPKKLNVNNDFWLQGQFPQQNVTMYQYVPAQHGWVNFGTL